MSTSTYKIANGEDVRHAARGPSPKRLAIAMISHYLPTIGAKRGGVDRVADELAEGLAKRGHDVVVWSYDEKPEGASYTVRPLPFRRWGRSWLGKRLTMGYFGNVLALLPDYRGRDVIIAHGDSLLLPLKGRPTLRIMHGSALGEALSATSPLRVAHQLGVYVQELVTGMTLRSCVAGSENTRQYNPFIRRVIPYGIDTDLYSPDPGAKTPGPSILFVGTLSGRKRGRLLLQWFKESIRPRHPEAVLWCVSEPGPEMPGVSYYHGIRNAELSRLFREAWVYASPSRYEGFGLPYAEAMASGTPVVASPNPGSKEVLAGGRFGVIVEDADFPAAVVRLLSDPKERRQWTERGLERARQYRMSTMIDRYEEVLLSLCSGGRKAGRVDRCAFDGRPHGEEKGAKGGSGRRRTNSGAAEPA